jgi:hypothetical protein
MVSPAASSGSPDGAGGAAEDTPSKRRRISTSGAEALFSEVRRCGCALQTLRLGTLRPGR